MIRTRRQFLRSVLLGGPALAGCSRLGRGGVRSLARADALSDASASAPGSPARAFLEDAGKALRGATLRVLTEDTPPSVACRQLVQTEFTPLTGIDVEWVLEPLEQVYSKIAMDAARRAGHHDLLYIDQSWLGRFAGVLEPMEPWLGRSDLAYPEWNYNDFLGPLPEKTASFEGRLVGIPYDITIFIAMYRRDVFARMGLQPPRDLDAWLRVCREIDRAHAPYMRGTTAQWKVGHYALLCHMSAWLWAHGGSFFREDGRPALDDAAGKEALAYMLELGRHMPDGVTTWDWHGESQSFARGEAALYVSWAEFFPVYDDPRLSRIPGLAEAAELPREKALRPPQQCGFGETPGISHQGGSCLGINRHSNAKEAAWVFLQWVTSPDITVRAGLLGSGASATRESTYRDPRILARQSETGIGTTRHFPVMRDAILNRMGTEPHHPMWPDVAMTQLPIELGKLVTRQQSIDATAAAMAAILRPFGPK